jgi:hypothetical protein
MEKMIPTNMASTACDMCPYLLVITAAPENGFE